MPAESLRSGLRAGEIASGRPVAANLFLPFIDANHIDVVVDVRPDVVVLFFGNDGVLVSRLRSADCFVLQQVGTVAEERRAMQRWG